MSRTWCIVQPDAPHWRDCLCYCNPLWFDHGGDWVEPSEEARPQARVMHVPSHGKDGKDEDDGMTLVSLGATPRYRVNHFDDEDDNGCGNKFTLPYEYDAVKECERLFGEFDLANGEKRIDNSALRLSSDAQFTAVRRRLDEGDSDDPPRSLYTDCNLYVIYVRQFNDNDNNTRERHELIEEYEQYRHKYRDSRVFKDDAGTADIALEMARGGAITREQRLEYYRKALFFTHDLAKKVKLGEEYVQYCESLKKGGGGSK